MDGRTQASVFYGLAVAAVSTATRRTRAHSLDSSDVRCVVGAASQCRHQNTQLHTRERRNPAHATTPRLCCTRSFRHSKTHLHNSSNSPQAMLIIVLCIPSLSTVTHSSLMVASSTFHRSHHPCLLHLFTLLLTTSFSLHERHPGSSQQCRHLPCCFFFGVPNSLCMLARHAA